MEVFVVGGTGAIGSHAVPALVRAGHTVTASARTPNKAARLREQGASPVKVSIFDRAALTEAFEGHDAIINIATAIPTISKFMRTKAWADNDRVRKEGSAAGNAAWLRVPGRAALLLGHRSKSLTRSLRVSNARFRGASGWIPMYPSAREGWIATAEALQDS